MKKFNNPDDIIFSYLVNKEDFSFFFPWIEVEVFNLSDEDDDKPKKKRGRKPKAHRKTDSNIFESKAAK